MLHLTKNPIKSIYPWMSIITLFIKAVRRLVSENVDTSVKCFWIERRRKFCMGSRSSLKSPFSSLNDMARRTDLRISHLHELTLLVTLYLICRTRVWLSICALSPSICATWNSCQYIFFEIGKREFSFVSRYLPWEVQRKFLIAKDTSII